MPWPPDPDSRADRVAGALALSALGDALGLPHEARGLSGEFASETREDLPPAETFREPEPNIWNIWAPFEATLGMRGVTSDDTAIKVCLLEPWLAQTRSWQDRTEPEFRRWLHVRPLESDAHRESMARGLAEALERHWRAAEGEPDTGAEFWHPEVPINWGMFVYGPLGLLKADLLPWVLRREKFTILDLGSDSSEFDRYVRMLHAALRDGVPLGGSCIAGLAPHEAAQRVSQIMPDLPVPAGAAFRPFRADVQGHWIRFWTSQGGEDPLSALRACVHSPGDTDTIAAHVGLCLGAGFGYHRLRQNQELARLLDQAEASVEVLLGRSLEMRVACYGGEQPEPFRPSGIGSG